MKYYLVVVQGLLSRRVSVSFLPTILKPDTSLRNGLVLRIIRSSMGFTAVVINKTSLAVRTLTESVKVSHLGVTRRTCLRCFDDEVRNE